MEVNFRRPIAPPDELKILVIKLDHLGDFIIGLPAMERLRKEFPNAEITLVCGEWNRPTAELTGLFDEVKTYQFFSRNCKNGDKGPSASVSQFEESVAGSYDLAIDMRVDEDTRFLLKHVNARIRCGIGAREQFPFLDVILSLDHEGRWCAPLSPSRISISPDAFDSRMQVQTPDFHCTDFSITNAVLLSSSATSLGSGRNRATFKVGVEGRWFGTRHSSITFEVMRNNQLIAQRSLTARAIRRLPRGVTLEFDNSDSDSRFTFRISCEGRPRYRRMTFRGVNVDSLEPVGPRYRGGELHIGEWLSLLVTLVSERSRDLYRDSIFREYSRTSRGRRQGDPYIIAIAPMSNSNLRDWPIEQYTRLIHSLLGRLNCRIMLLGSVEQRDSLDCVVSRIGAETRLSNHAGEWSWSQLPLRLQGVDLVICNNSGVAHLAAACGVPTLALYSASHPIAEWGPRGPNAVTAVVETPCAPCGMDVLKACDQGHVCMTSLLPETVYLEATRLLNSEKVADPGGDYATVEAIGEESAAVGATVH